MRLVFLEKPEEVNSFLLAQPRQIGLFPQTFEWLEFQKKAGRKIQKIGILDDQGKLLGVAGLVEFILPFGKKYVYSPRGPVFDYSLDRDSYREILLFLKKEIQNLGQGIIFWRFEPLANLVFLENFSLSEWQRIFFRARLTKSVQPKQTLYLNLGLSKEDLLSKMHEKTRYNIRLAERKGVIVRKVSPSLENQKIFFELLKATALRDKFRLHEKSYYQIMLESLGQDKDFLSHQNFEVRLWFAFFENQPIAGAIIGYFGDTATYLHGASLYAYRSVMAPFLLHWRIIEDAQKNNFKYYDFWGIDEKKWPGLTRFKRGFRGEEINYLGTFDYSLNSFWYLLYCLGRNF